MNTEKIKNIRDELEITQEDISRVLGCTRTAYSLWEINKNTILLYYLNKISNEYNINIDYLVDLSNEKYIKFEKTEIDKVKLGKKIKEARKSINYTQEKLASKLNTTHSVISAYESGKSTVSILFIIEIAKLTNKSLNWLLNKVQWNYLKFVKICYIIFSNWYLCINLYIGKSCRYLRHCLHLKSTYGLKSSWVFILYKY